MNVNDCSPEPELQVTACVFGSSYAFHLIAEGLTVCPLSAEGFLYDLLFCRYKALKSHTLYLNFDDVANTLPGVFHQL